MYPVRWQLEYGAGLLRTEPVDGETIRHAPRGAVALRLIDITGSPLCRVELSGKLPIFYRKRSIGVNDFKTGGAIRTDATIFGVGDSYAVEHGLQVSCDLWRWDGQRAVDASAVDYDEAMVELQLGVA